MSPRAPLQREVLLIALCANDGTVWQVKYFIAETVTIPCECQRLTAPQQRTVQVSTAAPQQRTVQVSTARSLRSLGLMADQQVEASSDVSLLCLARARALGLMRGIRGRLGVGWCGKFLRKSSALLTLSEPVPTGSVLGQLLQELWTEHDAEESRRVHRGEKPEDRNRKY